MPHRTVWWFKWRIVQFWSKNEVKVTPPPQMSPLNYSHSCYTVQVPSKCRGTCYGFCANVGEDYPSTFRNQPQDADLPTNFEACSHPSRPTEIK